MGIFTWNLAEDRRKKLRYGGRGFISMPDGSFIEERCYGGYGMFGSHDAYDVVVDLNRPYLKEIFEKIEEKEGPVFFGSDLKEIAIAYQNGDEKEAQRLADILGEETPYIKKDWKRNIGIAISCDHNEILPYPLKITGSNHPDKSYDELLPSISTQ